VDSKETRTVITDTGSKEVTHTGIDVQIFAQHAFYNGFGEVDATRIASCVEKYPQRLLGWFSFRANAPLRPSLRELAVHTQLENLAEFGAGRPVLFGMLTSSCSKNASTVSMDYRFVRRENTHELLQAVELSITNLKQDSQAEYGAFSACSSLAHAHRQLEPFTDPSSNPGLQALEKYAEHLQQVVCVCVCVCVFVCLFVRVRIYLFVCVGGGGGRQRQRERQREREGKRETVCVDQADAAVSACVCEGWRWRMCVCVREKKTETEQERERERIDQADAAVDSELLVYESLSYWCMRP
jgi:hypothetical protein